MTRVLVVGDDLHATSALTAFLCARDMDARQVATGLKALELSRHFPPEVLLCDWLLPGAMGGLALARALQAAHPRLVTVLMTGVPLAMMPLLPAGCPPIARVLQKPVSLLAVECTLHAALGGARVFTEDGRGFGSPSRYR